MSTEELQCFVEAISFPVKKNCLIVSLIGSSEPLFPEDNASGF